MRTLRLMEQIQEPTFERALSITHQRKVDQNGVRPSFRGEAPLGRVASEIIESATTINLNCPVSGSTGPVLNETPPGGPLRTAGTKPGVAPGASVRVVVGTLIACNIVYESV